MKKRSLSHMQTVASNELAHLHSLIKNYSVCLFVKDIFCSNIGNSAGSDEHLWMCKLIFSYTLSTVLILKAPKATFVAICGQCNSRSACTSAQPNLRATLSTYMSINPYSTDKWTEKLSGQRLNWSFTVCTWHFTMHFKG